ncbi:MAG: hypothetical protein G01um101433_885 [Parcubacteria group bacterium Gr01-1014_33]|nr:MAG: hypothetical protein G01um101433_885 [Parcubacteria group bacterium Gr01-1014_33]
MLKNILDAIEQSQFIIWTNAHPTLSIIILIVLFGLTMATIILKMARL